MGVFKKRIDLSSATFLFVETLQIDAESSWRKVKGCIVKYGFPIPNEDEAWIIWLTGLLALDTLDSFFSFDRSIAELIFSEVAFLVHHKSYSSISDWDNRYEEYFQYYAKKYLTTLDEFQNSQKRKEDTGTYKTTMEMLLNMVQRFGNNSNTEELKNSSRFIRMFKDFLELCVEQKISRWDILNKRYKIIWKSIGELRNRN